MARDTVIAQWLNAVNSDGKSISSLQEIKNGSGHFLALCNIISLKDYEPTECKSCEEFADERYVFIMKTLSEVYNLNMTELINPCFCKEGLQSELEKIALLLLCALVQTIVLTESNEELLVPFYGFDPEMQLVIKEVITTIIEAKNDVSALDEALDHALSSIHEKQTSTSLSSKKQPKKRRSSQRESQLRIYLDSTGLYKQVHNKVVEFLSRKVSKLENEQMGEASQSNVLSFGIKDFSAHKNDAEELNVLEKKHKDLEEKYVHQEKLMQQLKTNFDSKTTELRAAMVNHQFEVNVYQRRLADCETKKDDEEISTSALIKKNKELEQQLKKIKVVEDKTKELTAVKKKQTSELAEMKKANRRLQKELDVITERYGSVIQKLEDYEKEKEQLESKCNYFKLKVEEFAQRTQESSHNQDGHTRIEKIPEMEGHDQQNESFHDGEPAISKMECDTEHLESTAVKLENEFALSPLRQDLESQLISCKEQIKNLNLQLMEHQEGIKERELKVTQYEKEKQNCDERVLGCEETIKSNELQFENKVKELNVQLAEHNEQISEDGRQIVQHQETIKNLELQFESKVKEMDVQIAEHKRQISDYEREVVQYQETIKSLELQVENKVKELAVQTAERKEQIFDYEREVVQYQETIKSLELQVENKVKELAVQTAEREEQISDYERQVVQCQETIKSQELQFENKVKELDVQIAEHEEQISDYKRQVAQYQETNKNNESREVEHKAKIAEASSEMARCEEEVQSCKLRIAECERDNQNLQSSLSQAKEEMRKVELKITEYEGKVQEHQSQIHRYTESEKDLISKLSQCQESEKKHELLLAELKETNSNLQFELSQKNTEVQKTAELLSELEMKNQTVDMKPTHVTQEKCFAELQKKNASLENIIKEKNKLLKSERNSYNECKLELEYTGKLLKEKKAAYKQQLSCQIAEKKEEIEALKGEYVHKLEIQEQLLKKEIKKRSQMKDENRWLQGENEKKENTIGKLQNELNERTNIFQEQMATVEQAKNKKISQLLTDKEKIEKELAERLENFDQEMAKCNSELEKLQSEISEKAAVIDGMQTTIKIKDDDLTASHQERDALLKQMQECSHIEEISKAELKEFDAKFAEKVELTEKLETVIKNQKIELDSLLKEIEVLKMKLDETKCDYDNKAMTFETKLKEAESRLTEKDKFTEKLGAVIKNKENDIDSSLTEKEALKMELDELKRDYDNKVMIIETQLKAAEYQLAEKNKLTEKLQAVMQYKERELDSLSKETEALKTKLDEMKCQYDRKAETFETMLKETGNRLANADKVIENLETTIKNKENQLASSLKDREALKMEFDEMKCQYSSNTMMIETKLKATEDQLAENCKLLENSQKVNDDLIKRLKDIQTWNEDLTKKLNDIEVENEDLTKRFNDVEVQNEDLTKRFNDVEVQNAHLTKRFNDVEVQNEHLTRKLNDVQVQNKGLSAEIDRFQNAEVSSSQQHPSPQEEAAKPNHDTLMELDSARLKIKSLSNQIKALEETKIRMEKSNADLKAKIKKIKNQFEVEKKSLKEQLVAKTADKETSQKLLRENQKYIIHIGKLNAKIEQLQMEAGVKSDDEQDLKHKLEVTSEKLNFTEGLLVETKTEKESLLEEVITLKTALNADQQPEASVEAATDEQLTENVENECDEESQETQDLLDEKDEQIEKLTEELMISKELQYKVFDKLQRLEQLIDEEEFEKVKNTLMLREGSIDMMAAEIRALKFRLSQKEKELVDFNEVVRRYKEERRKIKELLKVNENFKKKLKFLEMTYTNTQNIGKMQDEIQFLTHQRDRDRASLAHWEEKVQMAEVESDHHKMDLTRLRQLIRMVRIKITLLSGQPDSSEFLEIQTDIRKRAENAENNVKEDEYYPLVKPNYDFSFLRDFDPPKYSHKSVQTISVIIQEFPEIDVPGISGVRPPWEKILYGKTPAMRFHQARIEQQEDLERRKKLPLGDPDRFVPLKRKVVQFPRRYVAALSSSASSSDEECHSSRRESLAKKRKKVLA